MAQPSDGTEGGSEQDEEQFLGVVPNCRYKPGLGYKMAVYDVFLTSRRLVIVKAARVIPWAPVIGVLAAGVPPAAFQSRIQRYAGKTVDQLLLLHKDNSLLPFEHVQRAVLKAGNPLLEPPNITIWTGHSRMVLQFEKNEFDKARELFAAALGPKLELARR